MDNPLLRPDPGLFIWTILTFLVLLVALRKLAWGPLLAALESRQQAIKKSLDDAQQAKAELDRLHQESAQIVRQARAEAENIVKNAERQIQLETDRALQQIRHEAIDLSVMIASKLLQRNLTKEDNERLIEEALKQVEGPRH